MGGFQASEVEDEWAYDFGTAGKGKIPLPSLTEVNKFRDQTREVQERLTGITVDGMTDAQAEEQFKRLTRLTDAERAQMDEANTEAVIEVCKGSPSRETILALPEPLRLRFVNYVGALLAPLF